MAKAQEIVDRIDTQRAFKWWASIIAAAITIIIFLALAAHAGQ